MKMRPLAAAVAATLGFCASPAFAYDLVDAYHDAVAYDAQLRSAKAAMEAIRERVPQAKAGLGPQVGASAAINENYVDTNISSSRSYLSQTYAVSLTYPLYRKQNVEAYEQSKLQLSIAESQYAQANQDLILRVAQAYFDVLSAQDNLLTIRSQKEAISEQLAAAKRNFEVGTTTVTDQQEAQARYDLTTAQELAAQNDLDIKRAALALLTGKPVGEVDVVRPGVDLQPPSPSNERAWTDSARQNALQVRQATLAAEIAKREIDRQRYGNYPTVDVVGQVAHGRNAISTIPDLRSNSAAIGVQVAIPLYTGGAVDARVREAASSNDKAQADIEVARRAAEQGSRQAFLGVNSGLAQVSALEAAERSSDLALASNKLGYQVGVRINIDVLNAQQQVFSTRRDLQKARYDVLVNGLRLKSATGTLDEQSLKAVNALLVDAKVAEEARRSLEADKAAAERARREVPPAKGSKRKPSR